MSKQIMYVSNVVPCMLENCRFVKNWIRQERIRIRKIHQKCVFAVVIIRLYDSKAGSKYGLSAQKRGHNWVEIPMINIVYGSILRPSSNNWASYRRLKWQIPALFL
jgi:hypothetical protein